MFAGVLVGLVLVLAVTYAGNGEWGKVGLIAAALVAGTATALLRRRR